MAAQTSTGFREVAEPPKLVSPELAGLLARNAEPLQWIDTEPYGAYLPAIVQALLDFGFAAANMQIIKEDEGYDSPTIQVRINVEDDVMEKIELLRKFDSEWWFKQSIRADQEIGIYLE